MKDLFQNLKEKSKNSQYFLPFWGLVVVFAAYVALTVLPAYDHFFPADYALIAGKKYTIEDIKEATPNKVYRLEKERADGLYQLFSQFANEKVVEIAAKDRGTTPEKLMVPEGDYTPSREEKMEVYLQFKDRMDGKSFQEVESEIGNYLMQSHEQQYRQNLFNKLASEYPVEIKVAEAKSVKQVVEEKGNPAMGPVNAKVTIIEFSDFECPFCKRSQSVNQKLREKYKGKIRWVFRDFPLPIHDKAMGAHIAANCAIPQGKFWDYFQVLFDNSGTLTDPKLNELAESVGMNMKDFKECLQAKDQIQKEIQTDIEDGQKLGVNGTPAFFINGIMVEGAQPYEAFERIIEQELN